MRFVLISDSSAVNVIEWDGKTPYDPGDDVELVQSDVAQIGDTYEKGVFTPAPPPEEKEPVSSPTDAILALQSVLGEDAAALIAVAVGLRATTASIDAPELADGDVAIDGATKA